MNVKYLHSQNNTDQCSIIVHDQVESKGTLEIVFGGWMGGVRGDQGLTSMSCC